MRSLSAVANACDWEIHQMDVKTAFLQGNNDEEIYMKQTEGYIDEERPDYVCKLYKSIYGLKQVARCWSISIDTFLTSNDSRKITVDPCVYIKPKTHKDGRIEFVIIALYVDDILFFSNNTEMLKREKCAIAQRFEVQDLGELSYVLGMCIKRNRRLRTMSITQTKYFEGVLKRFQMENCKPVSTPLAPGSPFDVKTYQTAIGCLTYAATISCPDLSAAVGVLSKYLSRPSAEHYQGIKGILRYIQGTLNYGLMFSADGNSPELIGYSDADWGGDVST